jgi:hypothetical protein
VADRDLVLRFPDVELADLTGPIDGALKRALIDEQRADLAQVVSTIVLPPTKPSGAISSRMRCPGNAQSSFSSRWISSLNESSFEPGGAR